MSSISPMSYQREDQRREEEDLRAWQIEMGGFPMSLMCHCDSARAQPMALLPGEALGRRGALPLRERQRQGGQAVMSRERKAKGG